MNNSLLTKTYLAGATVNPHRIVKWDSADRTVIQGAGFTAALIGIATCLTAVVAAGRVEVCRAGIHDVEFGGTVTRGQPLTSDAVGRAIAATMDPDNPPFIIGIAEESGVVGDIRPVLIIPTPAFPADGHILVQDVTITSAQLLALNATPKTLIAAPAAGKAIIPVMFQAYKAAGTAYAGIAAGEDLALKYTDASGDVLATMETTGFLDQATAQMRAQTVVATTLNPVAAAALVAHLLTGEIITGDSDLKLRILYRLVDTVLT